MLETNLPVDLSIIIPTRNEERHIGKCLSSLLAQDYTGSYEIIVVDGLSEDKTQEIVAEYAQQDKRIHLISNPKRITPVAFNLGVQAARGNIVMTVGGHWHLPVDYLYQINAVFQRHPEVDCAGGRIVREVSTEIGTAIEIARATLLGGGLAQRNHPGSEERIVSSANIAYIWRHTVFDRVGGFDEYFIKNQDNEFNLRTLQAGLLTLYAPSIVFYYAAPDTYRKLFWQMFSYSAYTPLMMIKHKRLFRVTFALPAIGLIGWMVASLWAILAGYGFIPLVLLGVYATIITLGAFVIGMRRQKITQIPLIALAYATIHLGVSIGYLTGLLKLANTSRTRTLWYEPTITPIGAATKRQLKFPVEE